MDKREQRRGISAGASGFERQHRGASLRSFPTISPETRTDWQTGHSRVASRSLPGGVAFCDLRVHAWPLLNPVHSSLIRRVSLPASRLFATAGNPRHRTCIIFIYATRYPDTVLDDSQRRTCIDVINELAGTIGAAEVFGCNVLFDKIESA